MVRVAILASGSGTNAERLMKAIGALSEVEVALVGTNKAEAGVMHRAKACGVSTWVFTREDLQAGVVAERLKQHRVDFVALAGFLLKVPDHLVQAFSGRILNLHPSLLPAFGGRGMYGRHVHEAVYKALVQQDVTETGITLHWVDARLRHRPSIFSGQDSFGSQRYACVHCGKDPSSGAESLRFRNAAGHPGIAILVSPNLGSKRVMNLNWTELLKSTMVMFAVIDIVGSIPFLLDIKRKAGDIHAERASLVALGIMLAFLFLGEGVINFFGH